MPSRGVSSPRPRWRAPRPVGLRAGGSSGPARAQDLTLRHRVKNYRVGDLDRRYASLGVHEDVFINYGFVTDAVQRLMHPRGGAAAWRQARGKRAREILDFVRSRGAVHPREVDDHFAHGSVTNYWGGSSNASTRLLEAMHYRGLLRVVRRERGIRIYTAHEHSPVARDAVTRRIHVDALVDVIVNLYASLPASSLSSVVRRLRYAVPQWEREISPALQRAKGRLARERVDGIEWYFPQEDIRAWPDPPDSVRLLAPFDPVVWDRRRFELLWGWAYRFEAYTGAGTSWVTTRCRCCGATASSAGATSASEGRCTPTSATSIRAARRTLGGRSRKSDARVSSLEPGTSDPV